LVRTIILQTKIVETPLEIIQKKTKRMCSTNVKYEKELPLCSERDVGFGD